MDLAHLLHLLRFPGKSLKKVVGLLVGAFAAISAPTLAECSCNAVALRSPWKLLPRVVEVVYFSRRL